MRKIKTLLYLVIFSLISLGFWSCSEDDSVEEVNEQACTEFTQEVKVYTDALSAYTQNPSPENCENFKTALMNFAEKYKNCALWTDSYQEALDNMDNYNCNEM